MFPDEILEEIFSNEEAQTIPVGAQATMVNVISRILSERGVDLDATVCKSELS